MIKDTSDYFNQKAKSCEFNATDSWIVLDPLEYSLQQKIESIGIPLKDWDIHINYGIKTGFNEAFIISDEVKESLIKEDPHSAEIIRPILRGRDIKRYNYNFASKYIITTFPAMHYDINDFPAIKKYLLSFDKRRLEQSGIKKIDGVNGFNARKRSNNKWFETQDNINYWRDFYKQKIIWGEISDRTKFCLDCNGEYFCEATTFIMTGPSLKFLLCYLNSSLVSIPVRKFISGAPVPLRRFCQYALNRLPAQVCL